MDYAWDYDSPLGKIILFSDGNALCGLWFADQKYACAGMPEYAERKDLPVFRETERWLDLFFKGIQPDFTPALNPKGTDYRKEIWKLLSEIPYGETVTYGRIADLYAERHAGKKTSARAVGNAVGHNPVSLIIPCHRVIGNDGSLTGYAGGTGRKQYLLNLEKQQKEQKEG